MIEKKSMTVSDKTIQAEGLSRFFKNLGKVSAKAGKKLLTNVLKTPSRAMDFTANIARAAASISPKNVISTLPEVINFYHTGKELYVDDILYFMFYKWIKLQKDYTLLHH